MNTWELLRSLNETCHFTSKEKPGQKASNSELKRWCERKSVVINGERPAFNEDVDFPVNSLILFPKRNRVTLF